MLCAVLVLSLSSCASHKTNPYYNRLAYGYIDGLKHDGYLIGLEKIEREMIKNKPASVENGFDEGKYQLLSAENRAQKKQNKKFKRITDDKKLMIVTHLFKYKGEQVDTLHNEYDGHLDGSVECEDGFDKECQLSFPDAYDYNQSFVAIESMVADIHTQLNANGSSTYTHLFIMSMGWNNDQQESIGRFNRIIDQLKKVKKDGPFNPLVVGVTWPSVWLSGAETWVGRKAGHLGSVFNKANDADEAGYTVLGHMLHQHLLKKRLPVPVVVIGHSYGARLVSRMVFSDVHQRDLPSEHNQVHSLVLLQPAFSVNRFITGEGSEGSPYDNSPQRDTRVLITSSRRDKANPAAFWSRFGGGKWGLNKAKNLDGVFCNVEWVGESFTPPLDNCNNELIMVDANAIVSDHNDILDLDMAQLIWTGINTPR